MRVSARLRACAAHRSGGRFAWSTRTSKTEGTLPPLPPTCKRPIKRVPWDEKRNNFVPFEQEIVGLRCYLYTNNSTLVSLKTVPSFATNSLVVMFHTVCCFNRDCIFGVVSLSTIALQVGEAN